MACRIQFLDHELSRFNWCKVDASGTMDCGEADISGLKGVCAKSSPVVVFLPQQSILLTRALLPPRAGKQQLNAIAFAVEEQLADDIDDNFFAVAPQQADHSVPVAVIERDIMNRLQKLLAEQHVQTRHILPQMYQCPFSDDEDWLASLCTVEGGYLLRYGRHAGMYCTAALLGEVLRVLGESLEAGRKRIDCYSDDLPGELEASDFELRRFSRLDLLSGDIDYAGCINLKQKEYQSSHAWLGLVKRWKWPLVTLLLVGLAFAADSLVGFWKMDREYRQLIVKQQELLRQHLPDETPGSRPKDQLVKRLAAGQSSEQGSDFLDLLHEYARLQAGVEGLTTSRVVFQQSRLVVSIESKDLKAIEALREKLAKTDIATAIENINIKPERTSARLILGEGS